VPVGAYHWAEAVTVDDCDFSADPAFENAVWPLHTPSEAEVTRVADMYLQESRYISISGCPSNRCASRLTQDLAARRVCRLVEETTVTQQILRVYCVKTFALLRKKLSKKTVGFGVRAVGVTAAVVFPVLLAAHVVAATTAAIVAGGSAGASATGGGILAAAWSVDFVVGIVLILLGMVLAVLLPPATHERALALAAVIFVVIGLAELWRSRLTPVEPDRLSLANAVMRARLAALSNTADAGGIAQRVAKEREISSRWAPRSRTQPPPT
jgi:hypothetical protein